MLRALPSAAHAMPCGLWQRAQPPAGLSLVTLCSALVCSAGTAGTAGTAGEPQSQLGSRSGLASRPPTTPTRAAHPAPPVREKTGGPEGQEGLVGDRGLRGARWSNVVPRSYHGDSGWLEVRCRWKDCEFAPTRSAGIRTPRWDGCLVGKRQCGLCRYTKTASCPYSYFDPESKY